MPEAIPEKYRDLFNKRAFASLATLMPDGRPQVTPVWCDLEGDYVLFNSAKGRQKDRNVRRDPRIANARESNRFGFIAGELCAHTFQGPASFRRSAERNLTQRCFCADAQDRIVAEASHFIVTASTAQKNPNARNPVVASRCSDKETGR